MSANADIIALLQKRGPLLAAEIVRVIGPHAASQAGWLFRHGRLGRTGEPRAYRYTHELDAGAAERRAAQQRLDTVAQRKRRGNGTREAYHARVRASADLRRQATQAACAANAARRAATPPAPPQPPKARKLRARPVQTPPPCAKRAADAQHQRSAMVQRGIAHAAVKPMPPRPMQPVRESVEAFRARGGRVQLLPPGAASQPLRHFGASA